MNGCQFLCKMLNNVWKFFSLDLNIFSLKKMRVGLKERLRLNKWLETNFFWGLCCTNIMKALKMLLYLLS